jgi:prepilin-type N-terminal cleavage/methylation domain-containing protein
MNNVKKSRNHLQSGLSLVELSIVMVIIGLLIGAVVGGLSVKKSSELRSIITQVDQFRVAISGFQDKYGDLPGDMPDAHSYWGNGSNTVCGTAAECNGDGNGAVEWGTDSDSETLRFWQHLSLAGFIEGQYTGSGTGGVHVPYANCPGTSRNGGGYHARTHTNDNDTVASTNIAVGGYDSATWPAEKLLSPPEAYYIDNKTDDGDADNGKSQSRSHHLTSVGWQTNCLSGADPNRTYIKTTSTQTCIMFFDIQ